MNPAPDGPSRTFVCASIVVAILVSAWFVFAASRQWFVGDDLWFLAFAQWPKSWRNWLRVFVPLGPRQWWSYRPLSIDVFFALCFRLFGREPFGYLAVSLSVHALTGLVVYRLARQLGFATTVAVLTALLSISRYPSLTEGLWISVCQYTIPVFFYALSLSLFIDYAKSSRIGLLIASCAALILTLLSNEMGATLAAVVVLTSLYLDGFGFSAERLIRTLRRTVPHLTITAAYLLFRAAVIGPAQVPPVYRWVGGWHILDNYFWALVFVFGAERAALLEGAIPVVAALVAVAGSRDRGPVFKSLGGVSVISIGWIAVAMLPYVGLPFPHVRFAMSIEVPVCLLCGACLNAFATVYAVGHRRLVESVLLVVLVLSVPYREAWARATNPKGDTAKRLVSLLRDKTASISNGTAVMVLYGSPGLSSAAESDEFRARVFSGMALWAFYTDKQLPRFYLLDARQPMPKDLQCPPCIFLDLKPGLVLEPAARGFTP
jgi:hypothetical protein